MEKYYVSLIDLAGIRRYWCSLFVSDDGSMLYKKKSSQRQTDIFVTKSVISVLLSKIWKPSYSIIFHLECLSTYLLISYSICFHDNGYSNFIVK
ncbi:putative pectinesterase/pectinesterase inhibitor [Dirofilaria immitis]